jgi:hypothetical protein
LKKRSKKLSFAVADLQTARAYEAKVFCFFFSKKKAFLRGNRCARPGEALTGMMPGDEE